MATKKNWLAQLQKLDGAVMHEYDPYASVVQHPSPSMNFIYGNTWGLPLGCGGVLYGPPKGGKTVILNHTTAQIHKDYPDGIVIKFDTEQREQFQLTPNHMKKIGIDPSRYIGYSVNSPAQVFDRIEKDIAALCDEGMPVKAIYIDSVNGIVGRRMGNAESIDKVQIGDLAQTLQDGFKRILSVQRKYRIAVIATCQVRAELDQTEIMRGNKFKMAISYGTKHWAEYFTFVEPLLNKDAKSDLLGNAFVNENVTDLADKGEKTGHKIRVTMKDSSVGPKGRVGVFTLDYERGFINTHEEAFLLGVGRNVIDRPNNRTYTFNGKQWTSKEAMIEALKDPELAAAVIAECRRRDVAGLFADADAQAAKDLAANRSPLDLELGLGNEPKM